MAATVQATCPSCRNALRIPAEWAGRTLRCKKCGALMQGKAKAAPTPLFETATAGATFPQSVPVPASEDGFGLPTPTDIGRRKYRRHRGNNAFAGAAVVVLLVAGLIGGGFYLNRKIEKDQAEAPKSTRREPEKSKDKTSPEPPRANPLAKIGEPFPRRLLFLHVSNYVYLNPLSPGTSAGKDMPTKSAEKLAFELRVPTEKDNNQLFVLSDSGDKKEFRPPVKSVLMQAYEQFFATSREQDRIAVYFGGHALLSDGKAYLAPVEADPDDANTLIPLADFYAKLQACKAQQKIVFFDVCRLDPDRGEERPGGDKMSAELAKQLAAAPLGVQVGLSCGPNQNAQETNETGSEFLTAFRVIAERTRRSGKSIPAKPEEAIPAAQWLDGMKAFLAEPRGNLAAQSVQTAGTEPGAQVAFNKDEAPAKHFDWFTPPKGVSTESILAILQQVNLPGIKADLSVPTELAKVYPFAEETMKPYAADAVADEAILKDPAKYPVRAAALNAMATINRVWALGTADKGGLMESFEGSVDDKIKKQIQDAQFPIAKINLELDTMIVEMEAAAKKLPEEKSKRWRAIFQYVQAQAILRWAYMNEYVGALGKIRTDSLPKDEKGNAAGLKLVSVAKPSRKDTTARLKDAQELLETMATEHKGTPYEVLAKLHRNISVGLDWRPVSATKAKNEDAK